MNFNEYKNHIPQIDYNIESEVNKMNKRKSKKLKQIILYTIIYISSIAFWFWAFQQITVYR